MLAKALAKCLASLDNDAERPPERHTPFAVDEAKPRLPVHELKVGVLVTKQSWRGPYERLLQLDDSSIATLDPADSRVTNRWTFTDLANVRCPRASGPPCI